MAILKPRQVTIRDGTKVWIRSAEAADAPSLVTLREDLVTSNPFQVSGPRDAWTREMALEKVAAATTLPGHLWLVASPGREAGSEVVGSISFRNGDRARVEHHGTFGIGNLAAWRGRGVGTVLIEALLDWAAANDTIEKVCLGCFATNTKARKLYRRLGFKNELRQRRFFKMGPGEYVDDIGMCIYVKPGIAPEGFNTWAARKNGA
jgi:RimJ/RimL family protein N-acetyltransferase